MLPRRERAAIRSERGGGRRRRARAGAARGARGKGGGGARDDPVLVLDEQEDGRDDDDDHRAPRRDDLPGALGDVEDLVDAHLGLVVEALALRVPPPVPGHLAHVVLDRDAVLIEVVVEALARVVDLDAGLARGADSTVAARAGRVDQLAHDVTGRMEDAGHANDDARLAALRVRVADLVALGDAPRKALVGRLDAFLVPLADQELIGVDFAVLVHVVLALGLAILQPIVRGVLVSEDDRERGGEQQDGLHCRFGWRSLRVAPAAGRQRRVDRRMVRRGWRDAQCQRARRAVPGTSKRG